MAYRLQSSMLDGVEPDLVYHKRFALSIDYYGLDLKKAFLKIV